MWPRKQLDIGWSDLAFGVLQVVVARAQPDLRRVVGENWILAEEAIAALSVRSGLDLLLTALRFPHGSEVIVSAVTIPDMARIIEHHGLAPVPVDIDAGKLQPVLEHLERSVTSRSRAILVAHLFGTHVDMGPIIEFAKQHDLVVIEDCAQAFVGSDYAGHSESTCALFSFGPIKTATALGGAILCVRDAELRSRMINLQHTYPTQTRWSYLKRLTKYAAFSLLCKPFNYAIMVRVLGMLGIDYDRALGNAAHSFGASNFFSQIRRQPCTPLVRMLQRRINTFDRRGTVRLRRRTMRGDCLSKALEPGMVIGHDNSSHTYWVVPLRVANRDACLSALRSAGFDATALSSLIVIATPEGQTPDESPLAPWLSETFFVPGGEEMPDDQWERLVAILQRVAIDVPARRLKGEVLARPRVTV